MYLRRKAWWQRERGNAFTARQSRLAAACRPASLSLVEALERRAYLSAQPPVVVVDVNGDGTPDAVVANAYDGGVGLAIGNHDGTFKSVQNTFQLSGVSPLYATDIDAADLAGKGAIDVVVATTDLLVIYPGNGDGTFAAPETYFPGGSPTRLAIGDFTGDGNLDIATVNDNGTVGLLRGCGGGAFKKARVFNDGLTNNSGLFIESVDVVRRGKGVGVQRVKIPTGR